MLLLAALGLAITFGLMGIINMAHGELLMIGAYTTYVCQSLFRHYLPGALECVLFSQDSRTLATGEAGTIRLLEVETGQERWRKLHRFTALAWIGGLVHSLGEGTDAGSIWFLTMAALTTLPAFVMLILRNFQASTAQ